MVPHKATLPPEISAAPFQFGGLSDTASVWVLLQALSEHEAKFFTQTLCPSTFNGSAPRCTAEANSWMVWLIHAIFFFFTAGSTNRRNKGNPVFLLVPRPGKMRIPFLLGSPTLSRETKMLHFSQASQVHMRSRKLGMPARFSAGCRPINSTKLHCLLTRN